MAVDHYENFPVASWLMPARLRPAARSIYAFARSADDLADEGVATPAQRIAALDAYRDDLDRIAGGQPAQAPVLQRLSMTVSRHGLPLRPFYDLLSAFRQDVETTRYETYDALSDYCRRSANPVGALMLHLYGAANPENLLLSDRICTALQLINFLQDVAIDWKKERIYLPLEDLSRFGVAERQLAQGVVDARWEALMAFQTGRARDLMLAGAPLVHRVPGRIGWELRGIVQGGLRILARLDAAQYDVFSRRPVLEWRDWVQVGVGALRMKPCR